MPLILPRRALLAGGLLVSGQAAVGLAAPGLSSGGLSGAGATASGKIGPANAPIDRLPVWPDLPPGGTPEGLVEREIPRSPTGPADDTAFLHVTRPELLHCRPKVPNGAAVLIVPGGGYARVAIGHAGLDLLRAFAAAGYAAFLLKYRLPGDGWAGGPDAPLQDAQRALRVIRARAATDGFDPARIAVWGGSAGGHLAARLGNVTRAAYPPRDAIDQEPLGLRAAILMYPVNLMTGPFRHAQSRTQLLGAQDDGAADVLAAEAGISPATPPTYLSHAIDDLVVPVENGLSYLAALRRAGVRCEMQVREAGGHGYGWHDASAGAGAPPLDWTGQALAFLRRHGA